MTRGPIIATIMTLLWVIGGLSGSWWFWIFLMILPVYTIIVVLNAWRKYDPDNLGWWWVSGIIILLLFFFIVPFGVSLWSMIIFLYILALTIAYGATFSPKVPRSFFLLPGTIIGIVVTMILSEFIELKQVATVASSQSGTTASSTGGLK